MTKIFNGTPHAINVVSGASFNPAIRKYTGGTVVLSIPSNGMLNAKQKVGDLPSLEFQNVNIPMFTMEFEGVDTLPHGFDLYIVSAMYASAAKEAGADMSKIATVKDPVYTEDGNSFVGCRGLCVAF